jgi:uncharacterized protein YndB with AHSA1/START domain
MRKTNILGHALAAAAVSGLALAIMTTQTPGKAGNSQEDTPQTLRSSITPMKDDLANRSPNIHWPEGFSPDKADLFSHNELIINAPCERVWKHIVVATKWPEWYPNSKDVRFVDGGPVLQQGSVFRWTTFGIALESKVNEFVPYSRIGWFGYAPGATPSFYHTWYLTPAGTDACTVVTDEVGKGADAAHLRQTDESLMHRGHDLWLATLKWMAEKVD